MIMLKNREDMGFLKTLMFMTISMNNVIMSKEREDNNFIKLLMIIVINLIIPKESDADENTFILNLCSSQFPKQQWKGG